MEYQIAEDNDVDEGDDDVDEDVDDKWKNEVNALAFNLLHIYRSSNSNN